MKKIFFLLMLFFCSSVILHSQYQEQIESETYGDLSTLKVAEEWNNYIYIGGNGEEGSYKKQPILRKLDLNGNIIWTVTDPTPYAYSNDGRNFSKLHFSDDGHIYAYLYDNWYNDTELWKIDTSGVLVYTHDISYAFGVAYTQESIDYGDTLIYTYSSSTSSDSNMIGFFDKNQGTHIGGFSIPGINYDYNFTIDNSDNVYYSSKDTIYKEVLNNIGTNVWKRHVPTTGLVEFRKLYFDAAQNAIYGFGQRISSGFIKGIICKIDASTGNLLWTTTTQSGTLSIGFQDVEVYNNHFYVAWKHVYVGSGAKAVSVSKIDMATGTEVWLSSEKFDPTLSSSSEEAAIDLKVEATGVYVSGYYNAANYDDGDWGIMKLNLTTGTKVFSTLITNNGLARSVGRGIYINGNTIVSVGEYGRSSEMAVQHFVTLDKNFGVILNQKDVGSLVTYPSKTVDFEELANGNIAVLQQKGRYGHFSIRDSLGNITWETQLSGSRSQAFQVDDMKFVTDSLIAIGGIGYWSIDQFLNINTSGDKDVNFVLLNPYTQEIIENSYFNGGINAHHIVDFIYDDFDNTFYVATMANNGSGKVYKWQVNYFVNYTTSGSLFFAPMDSLIADGGRLVNVSPTEFMIVSNNFYKLHSKSNLNVNTSINYSGQLNYAEAQGGTAIIVGKTFSNNPVIKRINLNGLTNISTNILSTISGEGLKWIPAEADSLIYLLSANGSQVDVTKYNIYNSTITWTTTVATSNSTFPSIYPTDISYNPTAGYIAVTGFRDLPNGSNQQIFYSFIDVSGTEIGSFDRNGDFNNNNKAHTLFSHSNNDITLVGGSIRDEIDLPSAFIFYLNEATIRSYLIGKVFLDDNANGIQDSSEILLSLGDVTIDNTFQSYIGDDGFFRNPTTSGTHTVTYNVPSVWNLTTANPTSTVNPYVQNDTLLFGVSPINTVNQVEPFIIAQDFVCNQSTPIYLQVKNTGTTTQNVKIKFTHIGNLNSVNQPADSITNKTLYWSYSSILPTQSIPILMNIQMPSVNNIGDTLKLRAMVYLIDTMTQMVTDSFAYQYQDILLCAYDPNDKQVTPMGMGVNGWTLFDQPFNYTVRFQNTGNYPAQDIVIIDTLDADLELSTFEMIATSHPISEVQRQGNVVKFIFNNIYLPDSVNNEPESHGFLSFRIEHKAGLAENTDINNTAYIYFDQNPPIVTNTTQNELVTSFGNIKRYLIGKVFLDNNNDGIHDVNEPVLSLGSVEIDSSTQVLIGTDGFFKQLTTLGEHTISYQKPSNWNFTTDSIFIINAFATNDTIAFGIKPINDIDKVEPFINTQNLICSNVVPLNLQVKNTGTTPQKVVVKFSYDATLNSTSQPTDSTGNNTAYWSFDNIEPTQSEIINLGMLMPNANAVGNSFEFEATVYLIDAATNLITNSFNYQYQDTLTCNSRSNYKQVTPMNGGNLGLTAFGQPLNYAIHFQNTGNNLVEDIVLIDTLDSNLNLSSFELLATSHSISEIQRENNVIKFIFKDIYLQDSLTNSNGSHGWVNFRISPKDSLSENTDIHNTASIYFDQNPAIITNTTQNRFVSTLGIIIGKVFLDNNTNGIQDINEPMISLSNVTIDGSQISYVRADGLFKHSTSRNTHSVTYNTPTNWNLTTTSALQINPYESNDTLVFGVNPSANIDAIEPFVFAQNLTCNTAVPFQLKIKNTGTIPKAAIVRFDYVGTLNNVDIPTDSVVNNKMYWSFNSILPTESQPISLDLLMPNTANDGDTLLFEAFVYLTDIGTQNITDTFVYQYKDVLTCSPSSNTKHVTPFGQGSNGLTLFNQAFNYTIRFQNTSTATVENLVIVDSLDANLDLNTIEILDASHPISAINREGEILTFSFNNINLPNSVTNEPESRGFVSFQITPKGSLPENTDIYNTAAIYFNQNTGILTNTTLNRLVSTLVSTNYVLKAKHYKVYPNPASNLIFIESENSQSIQWQLFNTVGQIMDAGKLAPNESQVNLPNLPSGMYLLRLNNEANIQLMIIR